MPTISQISVLPLNSSRKASAVLASKTSTASLRCPPTAQIIVGP
jgi:hypothetical protein